MLAVVVERIGSFVMARRDIPVPGPGEVLVRVSVAGLCRTDLKIIRVGHRDLVLPRVPGEEVVGTLEALGTEVSGWARGQRVYLYPGTSCGACPPCRAGAENLCQGMQIMGFHRDGGFAEYVVALAQCLIPLPDDLSDEEAVFIEPLSCCLNALELARVRDGEKVVIWGGGPAGVLLQRAAQARGAHALVIEPDPGRRVWSGGIASSPDQTFDVALVAVGDPSAYPEALERLKPRGRLVVFSGLPHDRQDVAVDLNRLHYLEQTIVGAYGCSFRHGLEALALLRSQAVAVRDLITHRLPLDALAHALDLVAERRCMKIHLDPHSTSNPGGIVP